MRSYYQHDCCARNVLEVLLSSPIEIRADRDVVLEVVRTLPYGSSVVLEVFISSPIEIQADSDVVLATRRALPCGSSVCRLLYHAGKGGFARRKWLVRPSSKLYLAFSMRRFSRYQNNTVLTAMWFWKLCRLRIVVTFRMPMRRFSRYQKTQCGFWKLCELWIVVTFQMRETILLLLGRWCGRLL